VYVPGRRAAADEEDEEESAEDGKKALLRSMKANTAQQAISMPPLLACKSMIDVDPCGWVRRRRGV
jgi:hypothetical protein